MVQSQEISHAAADGFDTYFAEKLWEMIPAIYRIEDANSDNPGVLRSMVEIMAKQAAVVRRSNDRLWEDQFIEWCNDWAVPYLADLVGTRLISAQNKRGRRIDVAKTIYYRRRKGTLRILEELISDITGWEGKVVENFRRLGRSRHGLDPFPQPLAGPLSGTLPGGWANLRQQHASELADGPFDEYHHTPDMRRHRGKTGRYGIPKLAFHLYRLKSYLVENSTPFSLGDGENFSFDPSGREVQLFALRNRAERFDWDEEWKVIQEWELPVPIRCRLLGHAEYELDGEAVLALSNDFGLSAATIAELETIRGIRFRTEARLRQTLDSFQNAATFADPLFRLALYSHGLIADCGKNALLPRSIDVRIPDSTGPSLLEEETISGHLQTPSAMPLPPEKNLIIDAENGRLRRTDGAAGEGLVVNYAYGFSGDIGAGTYDRRHVEEGVPGTLIPATGGAIAAAQLDHLGGTSQIQDSQTYGPIANKNTIRDLTLQAANHQRPYIRLTEDWRLRTGPNTNSFLTLDGLWMGAEGAFEIRLGGNYECVVIRHCTLDPGGSEDIAGNAISPVPLIIEGTVERLIIDHSIMGPIAVRGDGLVEELVVCDSIIQSVDGAVAAIDLDDAVAKIDRTTIFGTTHLHQIEASEVLMTDAAHITDTQSGCFRFSVAPEGSRVPRAYPHKLLSFTDSSHWFTSRVFGHPGYAQLSETAPAALAEGAENGSEIGAFSSLINPIKLKSLKTKVAEYMPFGLIPIFINET